MLSFVTACTPDDNIPGTPDLPGETTSYEIKGDMQLPMNLFIGNIPEEYAAFKEPLAAMSTMRENALKQELGTDDVQIGFRKITYLYPSTGVSGEPLTLSAVAFWLGYFSNGVWNDLKPENICLMEHYTITSDAEASDTIKQVLWDLLDGIPEEEFADFLVALDTVVNTIKEVRLRQSITW